jgi:hypothetical protein
MYDLGIQSKDSPMPARSKWHVRAGLASGIAGFKIFFYLHTP